MRQLGFVRVRPRRAQLETYFTTIRTSANVRSSSPSLPASPQRNIRGRRNAVSMPDSSPAYPSFTPPAEPPEELPPTPSPTANNDATAPNAPHQGLNQPASSAGLQVPTRPLYMHLSLHLPNASPATWVMRRNRLFRWTELGA